MGLTTSETESFTLCEQDEMASVLQNIRLIIGTRRGTVPMYRGFGTRHDFVDKPLSAARTLAAADLREAVERYEPRAVLKDIRYEIGAGGEIKIVPEVKI